MENGTNFEDGDKLWQINGKLEEIEEKLELVEQDKRQKIEDIVFLIVYRIRDGIPWQCIPIKPDQPLHIHIRSPTAQASTTSASPSFGRVKHNIRLGLFGVIVEGGEGIGLGVMFAEDMLIGIFLVKGRDTFVLFVFAYGLVTEVFGLLHFF